MALPVKNIVDALHDAGLSVFPEPGDLLRVTPASRLTPELRGLIRASKPELLRWFTLFAVNDPAPEPPADPSAWRELAQAYHAHHFNCPTCIAAGRGAAYGLRCGTGAALWTNYQNQI